MKVWSAPATRFTRLMPVWDQDWRPSTHQDVLILMKDLITLEKKHYNNNVPTKDQNDKKVFFEVLKDVDSMLE